MYLLLETVESKLTIKNADGTTIQVTPLEYRKLDMKRKVIASIALPMLSPDKFVFRTYKVIFVVDIFHLPFDIDK